MIIWTQCIEIIHRIFRIFSFNKSAIDPGKMLWRIIQLFLVVSGYIGNALLCKNSFMCEFAGDNDPEQFPDSKSRVASCAEQCCRKSECVDFDLQLANDICSTGRSRNSETTVSCWLDRSIPDDYQRDNKGFLYYKVHSNVKNFHDAENICRNENAKLIDLEGLKENIGNLGAVQSFWLQERYGPECSIARKSSNDDLIVGNVHCNQVHSFVCAVHITSFIEDEGTRNDLSGLVLVGLIFFFVIFIGCFGIACYLSKRNAMRNRAMTAQYVNRATIMNPVQQTPNLFQQQQQQQFGNAIAAQNPSGQLYPVQQWSDSNPIQQGRSADNQISPPQYFGTNMQGVPIQPPPQYPPPQYTPPQCAPPMSKNSSE